MINYYESSSRNILNLSNENVQRIFLLIAKQIERIKRMQSDAKYTHTQLMNLLIVKQKTQSCYQFNCHRKFDRNEFYVDACDYRI